MSNSLNVVRYVPLFKKHRVTHKTVARFQPLTLKIIKMSDVYARLGNRFEINRMWMFYVLSAKGKQLFWYEEHGEFHYARFRCKEIAECLGIPPEKIIFEDLSDEIGAVKVEDFRSVVRTIEWKEYGPHWDKTKIVRGTKV